MLIPLELYIYHNLRFTSIFDALDGIYLDHYWYKGLVVHYMVIKRALYIISLTLAVTNDWYQSLWKLHQIIERIIWANINN